MDKLTMAKENIYRNVPEVLKTTFDPFSVQVLKGGAESQPTSPLLWRHSPDPDASIYYITNSNGQAVILPFGTSQYLIYKEYSEGTTEIHMIADEVPEGWGSETASIEPISATTFTFTVDGFTTEVQRLEGGQLSLSPMPELAYEP